MEGKFISLDHGFSVQEELSSRGRTQLHPSRFVHSGPDRIDDILGVELILGGHQWGECLLHVGGADHQKPEGRLWWPDSEALSPGVASPPSSHALCGALPAESGLTV